ncbi:MAG TPA: outer membrane lipid asymmetry maintenance protein MlaD [Gammaproteobacteria bacterium]|nr:outer membrane lipid asymmetry maintenance protein MlaD [Gammaproteobacteria bacterium]
MGNRAVEIVVGLFVATGLAALVVLAFRVGNLGSQSDGPNYTVIAYFDNIGGLTVKAPVTLAGVRIGRVTNIDIDKENYRARVELSIQKRIDNLPIDSSAAILTSGLLGAKYVGLEPGAEDSNLKQGSEITLTQSAIVLENLIGQFLYNQADGKKK